MKRVLYYVLVTLFAAVFLFSAWSLGSYYLESLENSTYYDSLSQRVEEAKNSQQPTVYYSFNTDEGMMTIDPSDPLPERVRPILPEYSQLYLENSDFVGWIKISGTNVNYPVMQTPDSPDYYLKRNFDGEYSNRGCIYVKEDCDVFTPSDNITIYGHNMRDKSMFGDLEKYYDKSFWSEHRYITFDTILEHHTYEIIAVFQTTATVGKGFTYHSFVNGTQEEFDAYVAKCKSLSRYDTGVTAEYGDKLITLSTCDHTITNGRLVIVAKRIS